MPVRITGMVLAGDRLFLAGTKDRFDAEDPLAMFEGRAKGTLWALDPETGEKLDELDLDAPPVWDGMIAAQGRIFISSTDGSVRCYLGDSR
jgi:outer membrane protein assembly factor BamB